MADLGKLKSRLAALLLKARDAGSTPAEVEAAMNAAQKITALYGVTENDVRNAETADFREYEYQVPKGRTAHCPVLRYVGPAVARFTGATVYIRGGGKTDPIIMFGLDADVELATWLLASLRLFMDDQWNVHKRFVMGHSSAEGLKAERIGFIRAFCEVVKVRLDAMSLGAVAASENKGSKALIILKKDAVAIEMTRRGLNLGKGVNVNGRGQGTGSGAAAGAAAGKAAALGRGVEAGGRVLLGK